MPRSQYGVPSRHRRKKILHAAKGYWGGKNRLFKTAKESVERAMQYAYRDRRVKKREFRKLWITRINAAVRLHGLNYSSFMHLLNQKGVQIDRKVLANLAFSDPVAFSKLIENLQEN